MQKHQYSDTVEKLATVEQAKERYKLCRNTLIKYAKQYDALRKFNTAVRIDIEKFDEGLSSENETNFKGKKMVNGGIVRQVLDKVCSDMCDEYCKWPEKWNEEAEGMPLSESEHCQNCPLLRLL